MLASANAAGSVEYRNLNHKEQKCFDDARSLEVNNLLDLDAYELLSLEESIAFRNEFPDFVLTSRFVDRWKPTDAGSVKAKSRIVIWIQGPSRLTA